MNGDRASQLIDQAKPLLHAAVSQDTAKNYMNSVNKYIEGATYLLEAQSLMTDNDVRKANLNTRVTAYINRAEELKKKCLKTVEKLETRKILDDSVGNDYFTLFGRCIDNKLTSVIIEDAYINQPHQILNFVRFCEILVKHGTNLKNITLITNEAILSSFDDLKSSLLERHIELHVSIKQQLHDREIMFDNGWIIKIGRGLDYFKPPSGKFVLGSCDLAFRKCRETNVDIYKMK